MSICPSSSDAGPCDSPTVCQHRSLCAYVDVAPLYFILEGVRPAVHFIGFRGEEYWSAVRVFGRPDFVHRGWDTRAQREIARGWDTVIFAKHHDQPPSPYCYDDSAEPDDPATLERNH